VDTLLRLYREALLAEDSDRLQALLQPQAALTQAAGVARATRQAANGTFADLTACREAITDTFRTQALTALELPEAEMVSGMSLWVLR
jgi:hypothetical protein